MSQLHDDINAVLTKHDIPTLNLNISDALDEFVEVVEETMDELEEERALEDEDDD